MRRSVVKPRVSHVIAARLLMGCTSVCCFQPAEERARQPKWQRAKEYTRMPERPVVVHNKYHGLDVNRISYIIGQDNPRSRNDVAGCGGCNFSIFYKFGHLNLRPGRWILGFHRARSQNSNNNEDPCVSFPSLVLYHLALGLSRVFRLQFVISGSFLPLEGCLGKSEEKLLPTSFLLSQTWCSQSSPE